MQKIIIAAVVSTVLTGCGGSSNDSVSTPTPTPVEPTCETSWVEQSGDYDDAILEYLVRTCGDASERVLTEEYVDGIMADDTRANYRFTATSGQLKFRTSHGQEMELIGEYEDGTPQYRRTQWFRNRMAMDMSYYNFMWRLWSPEGRYVEVRTYMDGDFTRSDWEYRLFVQEFEADHALVSTEAECIGNIYGLNCMVEGQQYKLGTDYHWALETAELSTLNDEDNIAFLQAGTVLESILPETNLLLDQQPALAQVKDTFNAHGS